MFKGAQTQHILAANDFDAAVKYPAEKPGFTLENTFGGWGFLHLDNFYPMVEDCEGEVPARETNNNSTFAYVNCRGIDDLYEQYKESGF